MDTTINGVNTFKFLLEHLTSKSVSPLRAHVSLRACVIHSLPLPTAVDLIKAIKKSGKLGARFARFHQEEYERQLRSNEKNEADEQGDQKIRSQTLKLYGKTRFAGMGQDCLPTYLPPSQRNSWAVSENVAVVRRHGHYVRKRPSKRETSEDARSRR